MGTRRKSRELVLQMLFQADMGKQTLVTLLGVEGARAEAQKRAHRAVEALGPYAERACELSALPFFLLDRDS